MFELFIIQTCPDHAAWHPDHRRVIGYRFDDHRASSNFYMISDLNITKNFRACPDHHVIPQRRMAFSLFFTGTSKSHALIEQDIIADLRCFPNHNSGAVVDKEATPNPRTGVNLNSCKESADLRDYARYQRYLTQIQPVCQPVQQNGMEARITQNDFQDALRGRIFTEDRIDLLPDCSEHT